MERFIGTLYPQAPYDFELTVRASRYYTVLGAFDGETYRRAVRLKTGLALVRVVSQGTIGMPALDVYLLGSSGLVDLDELMRVVARLLNIRSDLNYFYQAARSDPILWHIIKPLYGLHILQTGTLHEAVTVTVIEQQIALAAAQRGERWLVEWGGESISYRGDVFYVFPLPERIAAATADDLTPLKITFRRMNVLIDIARQWQKLEQLRAISPGQAYEGLLAIRGVGHWTAAWSITRSMGLYMYVGSADVALRAATNHYFFNQKGRCSPEETDALFQRYGMYAGAACFYILTRWAMEKY